MTDEELQEMIDEADRDGDSEISEDEFLVSWRKKLKPIEAITTYHIIRFAKFIYITLIIILPVSFCYPKFY